MSAECGDRLEILANDLKMKNVIVVKKKVVGNSGEGLAKGPFTITVGLPFALTDPRCEGLRLHRN